MELDHGNRVEVFDVGTRNRRPWIAEPSAPWNWPRVRYQTLLFGSRKLHGRYNNAATTTWNWSRGKVGDFIAWIKEVAWPFLDGVATTTWNWVEGEAFPAVAQAGKAVINAVVEVSGKVYDAIKKGLNTGDWADFWDITSDLWSKGVVIAISLSSAVQGIGAVLTAISKGLGLVATGATVAGSSLGALGTEGYLGQ